MVMPGRQHLLHPEPNIALHLQIVGYSRRNSTILWNRCSASRKTLSTHPLSETAGLACRHPPVSARVAPTGRRARFTHELSHVRPASLTPISPCPKSNPKTSILSCAHFPNQEYRVHRKRPSFKRLAQKVECPRSRCWIFQKYRSIPWTVSIRVRTSR